MTESAILIQSHSSYDLRDFSCQFPSQDYYYHDNHQHQKLYHAAHDNQAQSTLLLSITCTYFLFSILPHAGVFFTK